MASSTGPRLAGLDHMTAGEVAMYARAHPDKHDELVHDLQEGQPRFRIDVIVELVKPGDPRPMSAAVARVVVALFRDEEWPYAPELGAVLSPEAVNVFASCRHRALRAGVARHRERAVLLTEESKDAFVDQSIAQPGPPYDLEVLLGNLRLGDARCLRIARRHDPALLSERVWPTQIMGVQFSDTVYTLPDPRTMSDVAVEFVMSLDAADYVWDWLQRNPELLEADTRAGLARLRLSPEELVARTSMWSWPADPTAPACLFLFELAAVPSFHAGTRADMAAGLQVLMYLTGSDSQLSQVAVEMYPSWLGTLPELVRAARDLLK